MRGRFVALLFACGLAVAGCSTGGSGSGATGSWLTDVTSDTGIDFVYEAGATGQLYMPEVMGSGAALFDFDQDGDLDVYLTNGNRLLPEAGTAGEPLDRLWRQEPGGRFVDVTAAAGLGNGGYGMGVAVGDIDNDGHVDLYVTNYGPNRLYRNRGDGTFEEISSRAGAAVGGWSTSCAFVDYDRDGFLDLYIARYVDYRPGRKCYDDAARQDYCGPLSFAPVHDVLLHNNGDLTFTDASESAGIASVSAAGLGVVCEDFNEDGWLDVYVANDAYANQLWINQQDGTFRDDAMLLGAALNLHGQAEAGMGVFAADVDNDLDLDIFITHLVDEKDTLFRNLGPGKGFIDASGEAGVAAPSMEPTGFGTAALDIELDGDLDLLVANGRVRRGETRRDADVGPPWDILAEQNLFYLNDGTGRFALVDAAKEPFASTVEVSRALAIGDIDRDGDLDVLLTRIGSPARLYRNEAPRQGHWLAVRATDPRYRRDALGARVTVAFDGKRLMRTITSAFSYLSSSHPEAHFGLGPATSVSSIDVVWPDGLRERFAGGPADRAVELVRGQGEPGS